MARHTGLVQHAMCSMQYNAHIPTSQVPRICFLETTSHLFRIAARCFAMFDDVPDGCVAHIVEQLHSIQDVFNFQRTCSRFAAVGKAHQAAWLSLLRRDFDIRLEVR